MTKSTMLGSSQQEEGVGGVDGVDGEEEEEDMSVASDIEGGKKRMTDRAPPRTERSGASRS